MANPPPKRAFGNWADPEVRHAWRRFGGLSVEEAAEVFIQNPFGSVESFRWISAEAFVYYFPIVMQYVTSDAATGDSDTISCLAGILESQIAKASKPLAPIASQIIEVSEHVLAHYSDFDLEYDLYGDVKMRYEQVARTVEPLGAANGG